MEKSEMQYLEELDKKIADLEKRIGILESGGQAPKGAPITEPVDIMADEVPFVVPARKQELGIDKAVKEIKAETAEPAKAPAVERAKQAWMVDAPASPLSNILSGIALKDRSVFINTLFKEDPKLFIDTMNVLNAMPDFSQALEYIYSHFPAWNFGSAVVYRFMMAVRRKLN